MRLAATAILGAMLGLALTGCDGGGKTPASAPTVAATPDPMEAKMLAATDAQRRVAFLRGILDSDYPCNKITKIENRPRDPEGHLVWWVNCDVAREYTITLMPGGVFYVSGVPGGEVPGMTGSKPANAAAPSGR